MHRPIDEIYAYVFCFRMFYFLGLCKAVLCRYILLRHLPELILNMLRVSVRGKSILNYQ